MPATGAGFFLDVFEEPTDRRYPYKVATRRRS